MNTEPRPNQKRDGALFELRARVARWLGRFVQPSGDVMLEARISKQLAADIATFETEAEMESHREWLAATIALWRWAAMRSKEGKAIVALEEANMKYNELRLPQLETLKMKALAEKQLRDSGFSGESIS